VHGWIEGAGMESTAYGTHSLRRTKAAQIYRKTGNLRAVQLLLGHTKIESTVRYLGIEVDDALSLSEQVELWTTAPPRGCRKCAREASFPQCVLSTRCRPSRLAPVRAVNARNRS
jgi:Phage integrase family